VSQSGKREKNVLLTSSLMIHYQLGHRRWLNTHTRVPWWFIYAAYKGHQGIGWFFTSLSTRARKEL